MNSCLLVCSGSELFQKSMLDSALVSLFLSFFADDLSQGF